MSTIVESTERELVWRPQDGPQMQAFQSRADVLVYGGQAGGGKTWMLVAEPLRRVHNSGFRAVIFRRTYPQILGAGGLWELAQELYRPFGARMREGHDLDATFPSGATVSFRHLQHEKTKYEYQGHQICYLAFDELTHFTESQFWYLLSRNRSTCGIRPYVRATCNPEAGSWVAELIDWWIGEDGLPNDERAGKLRYFAREDARGIVWGDSREEVAEQTGLAPSNVLSFTFIPARLADNPALESRDPGYRARLMALPKIERQRLLEGNWRAQDNAIIEPHWLRSYRATADGIDCEHLGRDWHWPQARLRRAVTIDTAGTTEQRAAEDRGNPPSYSCAAVWDVLPRSVEIIDGQRVEVGPMLFLRAIWRDRVEWPDLVAAIKQLLREYQPQRIAIENAHYGAALRAELRASWQVTMVPTKIRGMQTTARGAKLERAVASGMLAAWESGRIYLPEAAHWLADYRRELLSWTGLPTETADQIDVTSHAVWLATRGAGAWGGAVPTAPTDKPTNTTDTFGGW